MIINVVPVHELPYAIEVPSSPHSVHEVAMDPRDVPYRFKSKTREWCFNIACVAYVTTSVYGLIAEYHHLNHCGGTALWFYCLITIIYYPKDNIISEHLTLRAILQGGVITTGIVLLAISSKCVTSLLYYVACVRLALFWICTLVID